jgi:hypothetical protein
MRVTDAMRAAMALSVVGAFGFGYSSGSRHRSTPNSEPEPLEVKPSLIDVGMKPALVASALDLSAIEAAKNKRARKLVKRKELL